MTWTVRLAAVAALAVATVTVPALWLALHGERRVDASGHETGPYAAWQVVGIVVCLVVVAVVALRWLPPSAVVAVVTVSGTTAWSVAAANADTGADANLWPVGALFLFVGLLVGSTVVTLVADLLGGRRHRAAVSAS